MFPRTMYLCTWWTWWLATQLHFVNQTPATSYQVLSHCCGQILTNIIWQGTLARWRCTPTSPRSGAARTRATSSTSTGGSPGCNIISAWYLLYNYYPNCFPGLSEELPDRDRVWPLQRGDAVRQSRHRHLHNGLQVRGHGEYCGIILYCGVWADADFEVWSDLLENGLQ